MPASCAIRLFHLREIGCWRLPHNSKNYRVRTGCEIAGQWRMSGETISLTAEQARELAPPFGDVVSPVISERGSGNAGFDGSKRRKRQVSQ
jgi:hypothetical protein